MNMVFKIRYIHSVFCFKPMVENLVVKQAFAFTKLPP